MAQPGPNGVIAIEVGSLNVIPFAAVPIACISMELVCECQIEICETTTSTDSEGHTSTHYHYYPHSLELLHTQPVSVFEARQMGGVVFSAPTSIPFGIPLPINDYPSSLRTFPGKKYAFGVTYHLKINAFDTMGQLLNNVRCEVKVFALFGYVGPEKPMLLFANHEYKTFCCFPTNKFVVYCTTDKTVYCPGDQIKISYWVQTENPETLPKFKTFTASLKMYAKSFSPPGVHLYRNFWGGHGRSSPHPQNFKHVLARQDLDRPVLGSVHHTVLTLPPDCGPASVASVDTGNTLSWGYTVTLRLKVDNILGSKVDATLPIVINGKNAEQLTMTDPQTLRFANLPVGAAAAQQLYATSATSLVASAIPVYSEAPTLSVVNGEGGRGATEMTYVSVPVAE